MISQGATYLEELTVRCRRIAGCEAPLVASHNDLTMQNVMIDSRGQLGVIDWESGRLAGLPLVDFFYAATDAMAATHHYADRLKAFKACFDRGGSHKRLITRLMDQISHSLNITPDLVDLCFHACWLHHASNEHEARPASQEQSFLAIVQWIASHLNEYRWGTSDA
jgi:hypothetical protein